MHQNPSTMFVRTAKWMSAMFIASAAFSSFAAAASQGRDQGMLLLHSQAQNKALDEALPHLEDQGCTLWRRGSVAGTQGNLGIGAPDRFVLLACTSEVLDSARHRQVLAPILGAGKDVRAVEGPILYRKGDETERATEDKRAYVLKISHYNNLDPDGRDRALDKINALAAERVDAWKTEAFVAGLRAVGMTTPDEVVVIHYDDPQQGERFRRRNPDILEQIGAFNRKHLSEFTYISAAPDQ